MAKWTEKELDLLHRYFPDFDTLVRLLKRNKKAISYKARKEKLFERRRAREKRQRQSDPRKVVLIEDTRPIIIKSPSFSATMKEIESRMSQALISLMSGTTIDEWSRILDEYHYLELKQQQLEQNKRYYSK